MAEDAKPKTKIYHIDESGSIAFRSARKSGEVRIPNYVYDLWLPLLGIDAIGVYTLYCRLEFEGGVTRITQDRLAKMCRMSKTTLRNINKDLQTCGFIEIKPPKGKDRLKHYTTEVTVKDPPPIIDALLIRQFQTESGYEPLTAWLCETENHQMYGVKPTEVLDSTSGGTTEYDGEVTDDTSKVASLVVTEEETPAPQADAVSPSNIVDFSSRVTDKDDAEKPKRERKLDPLFDAVKEHIFGIEGEAAGGRIGKISSWLAQKNEGKREKVGKISKAAEPQHVKMFAEWCERKGFTPPRDFVTFVENWRKWATEMNGSLKAKSPLAGLKIITNDDGEAMSA